MSQGNIACEVSAWGCLASKRLYGMCPWGTSLGELSYIIYALTHDLYVPGHMDLSDFLLFLGSLFQTEQDIQNRLR